MQYGRKELLTARSERVKGIDFHPTEPWILTTLYSGHVHIWSFDTKTTVKTFELTNVPVRAGRFIARKNWIVCGSDDYQVRVYNYNTSEKVTSFEAHPDYIRAIAVHPTKPYILTASDDMTIKRWDWENSWALEETYEDHNHYVMGLAINPKDMNTFASACLDRTVKVWNIKSDRPNNTRPIITRPNYTIEAHETKGVNHVDYYPHADNPYLLTTSDDQTVKIWDYTNKQCMHTLGGDSGGHTSNVSFACYHSVLPLIISGSEDGTIKIWDSTTYKLEDTIRYNLERAWCVSSQRAEQGVAVGFDDGAVVFKLGRDDPAVSMQKQGWLAWYAKKELHIARIPEQTEPEKNGSRANTIPVKREDFNAFYPQTVAHSKNDRFFSVCGATEYTIHSARGGKRGESIETVGRGTGSDLVWGVNTKTNNFAIITSGGDVKIMDNQEGFDKPIEQNLDLDFKVDGLTGGALLGLKANNRILMYDWDKRILVRQFLASSKDVYWSESGEFCAIACEDTFYILKFSHKTYIANLKAGKVDDEGVAEALDPTEEIHETVRSGQWVGDCFMYTNSANLLNYFVGGQTYTVAHFDKPMYLLSYLPNRGNGTAYLADKDVNIVSHAISRSILEYQTLFLQGKMELAAAVLEGIDEDDQRNKVARFLEGQGEKQLALEITTDQEHKFDLALALNDLPEALSIARLTDIEHRWKIVGDAAMAVYDLVEAENCFKHAKDLGSLLLLYTATNDREGLEELTAMAEGQAVHNVAFSCLWHLGNVDNCIDLLLRTERTAEAALFAHTYKPSRCREIIGQWKTGLDNAGKGKVSRILGVPPEKDQLDETALFKDWDKNLQMEEDRKGWSGKRGALVNVSEDAAAATDGNGVAEGEDGIEKVEEAS